MAPAALALQMWYVTRAHRHHKNIMQQKKKTEIYSDEHIITHSTDENKFPHGRFNIRLEYMDGIDKRICWFECKDQFIKHVTRYKITKYEATTNDLAVLGKSTRTKGKQQRQ